MNDLRSVPDLGDIVARGPKMVQSPASFDGTLQELFEQRIAPNLPLPNFVIDFHGRLEEYVSRRDPLFLVRYVRDTERRQIYTTNSDGSRFKATDNAPAWWIHSALFHRAVFDPDTFADVIATIPAHMFDMARYRSTANAAGWHIAHIFDVKDRNTDFHSWRKRDLTARFIRNVHPCNYFLVPKTDWTRWGGDERVIGFFAAQYKKMYADVWDAFLLLGGSETRSVARVEGTIRYQYPRRLGQLQSSKPRKP